MPSNAGIQLIVNPAAGRFRRAWVLERLCQQLRGAGFGYSVCQTRGPGDAREAARRACRRVARAIVVVGGDGTVSEVVSGLAAPGPPILIIPSGTENILAKYLGIRSGGDLLWQLVHWAREVRLDIAACGARRFLLVAGVGFDAEVVRRLTLSRTGHISYLSYFWPLWRTLWGYRYPELAVELDGQPAYRGRGLVLIGNVPRYAMGFHVLREARPDDGLLDVCIFSCRRPTTLLNHAFKVLLQKHIGSRDVLYRQARRVRVESDERVPVQLDGDAAGHLPAEFTVTGEQARFLVPPDWEENEV